MPTPGPLELVIILVIALLILGPGRLPDVGSALGKSIREFRKSTTDDDDSPTGATVAKSDAAPADASDVAFCTECGSGNVRTAKFCAGCGHTLEAKVS